MKDILLITPPFTQLNTPYPATAYLKGFLKTKSIDAYQMDLGIEVILAIFSRNGLSQVFDLSADIEKKENEKRIYTLRRKYEITIDAVIRFLQGKQPSLARQIAGENYLPEASRFDQLEELEWAFGNMGMQDKAKHLATLYLEDISDYIIRTIDSHFGFSRYAERIACSANSFDEIYEELQTEASYIDEISWRILKRVIEEQQPKLICFSAPFPGNILSAFRNAQYIKEYFPSVKISLGGGFANTELRSVKDQRVFEFFDFITLDDGELPLELLHKHVMLNNGADAELKRTFLLKSDKVTYVNNTKQPDYKQNQLGTPDYSNLQLDNYISVIEIANPMHSLWSDGRWTKLTMAHGCYWGKCTFCDISLDYIKVYEPLTAKLLVDRMEELIQQTGENGFHFVDEAAPPALMRELALEIIKRELVVTWWTNIRFEKSFTLGLCKLLQASGCIAISGGLEVASDRLLQLIDKGVTVEQVADVTRNLTESGIMVHAYLMYGYPTQTVQETMDSLEMVRQLFELGVIQSGFWHQFALTAHSPVGLNPEAYGIVPKLEEISFANNDVQFVDKTGINHAQFSQGLKASLFNYMHGVGFDLPLHQWFDFRVPKTTVSKQYIQSLLERPVLPKFNANAKVIWLGSVGEVESFTKSKKGNIWEMVKCTFYHNKSTIELQFEKGEGDWLVQTLSALHPSEKGGKKLSDLKLSFELQFENFELFWSSKSVQKLQEVGLIVV